MPRRWSDADLDGLLEEILVDAYGDSERSSSFERAFDEAGLPVAAKALGMASSLVAVRFDGDERRGLQGEIVLDGARHRMNLFDVKVTDGKHDAARLLAALVGSSGMTDAMSPVPSNPAR